MTTDTANHESTLTDGERRFALAAVMVRVLGEKYDVSDADMNEACARALAINMAAEGGDEQAAAFAVDAALRLHSVWQGVHAARAAKTVN